MIAVDDAWEARRNERGEVRSCNPETEFRKGFAAGNCSEFPDSSESPIDWPRLYRVTAERAAGYEMVLRANGIDVRDALDPAFVDAAASSALVIALAERDAAQSLIGDVRAILSRPGKRLDFLRAKLLDYRGDHELHERFLRERETWDSNTAISRVANGRDI